MAIGGHFSFIAHFTNFKATYWAQLTGHLSWAKILTDPYVNEEKKLLKDGPKNVDNTIFVWYRYLFSVLK